jgi:hypothetical protein
MQKYLYLTKPEWQESWIHGGKIPISLASSYLNEKRAGTGTPDENLIHDSSVDLTKIPGIRIGLNVRGISMTNITRNGQRLPDVKNGSLYKEDGLILSFCNTSSVDVMQRLGKAACVKIVDMHLLRSIIDEQLGMIGQMAQCRYTGDHQRGHFLKHNLDSWQQEYRMFWKGTMPRTVLLPPGIAEAVLLP